MSHKKAAFVYRVFDRKLVLYTLEPAWLRSMSQVLHCVNVLSRNGAAQEHQQNLTKPEFGPETCHDVY